MAAPEYILDFAGVPFVLDVGKAFGLRQQGQPEIEDKGSSQYAPKKYQPLPDLVDELNRLIPFQYLKDFSIPSIFPGRNLSKIAYPSEINLPDPTIRIGDWYYPTNAIRWSVFRGLAVSSQVKAMLAATAGTQQQNLRMGAYPISPDNSTVPASSYALETGMYLLPPKPLAEHGGQFDGLYLVTLVDERYYLRGSPVSLHADGDTTWEDLIDQVAEALNITINDVTVPAVYGGPGKDSQLWTCWESAPVLLDALAANIGCIVVREFDGTYTLLSTSESNTIARSNRGNASLVVRTAGGDYFTSGTLLPVGNLNTAKNAVVPATVHVSFPKYVFGDDPVPHFVNPRYQNQRPSAWFEESFGDCALAEVPISSGGVFVSGLAGVGDVTLHSAAKALYSGEIGATSGGIPLNFSGLTALAMQLAGDYYASQVVFALDEVYPGTYAWSPEGFHDIVWTYSARSRQATTRVIHTSWTLIYDEFQHETPPLSGYTATQPGVGGPSVAQSIRDSFGSSGTFIGTGGTLISGNWASGSISTTLSATLFSGDYVASLTGVNHFPTQNRWFGRINGEDILFNGTSGGISGNMVSVVYRGTNGTIQTEQANGSFLKQVLPDTTHGVNLTTYEKGLFTYPQEWTSGGIQGVNIIPQIQTVQVLDGSGIILSGITHYSGRVNIYDATTPTGSGPWVRSDLIWAVERNDNGLESGSRYDGQFVGYSLNRSGGMISGAAMAAPIYALSMTGSGGGGGETSFLALLTDKVYTGTTPAYSWVLVLDDDAPPPLTYTQQDTFGEANLFQEQNRDLVVVPTEPLGPNSPATGANDSAAGDVAWTDPGNIVASEGSYATSILTQDQETEYLVGTDYSFSLPANSRIRSVKVEVECKASSATGVSDIELKLVKGGVITGNSLDIGGDIGTSDEILVYGPAHPSVWGVGLDQADVEASDFGAAIRFVNTDASSRTVSVDHIRITVYFGVGEPELSVVRCRQGNGDYYLTDQVPWEDICHRTVFSDSDGDIGYFYRFDQATGTWQDGFEVRIVLPL